MLKKHKRIIVIMLVCCLMLGILLKSAPNKMSYTVEKEDDNFIVSIFNAHGEKIFEEQYRVWPNISKVGKNTVMVTVGKGNWWQSRFINGKTDRISDWFGQISTYDEQLVVYGTYEDNKLKIIIRDIYIRTKLIKKLLIPFHR